MKQTAKDLLSLPLKSGEVNELATVSDMGKSNITLEQAIVLKQAQAAMNGNTDAAMFVMGAASVPEESKETAISEAAKEGNTLEMLESMRDKLAAMMDKSTDLREVTATSRQLVEINDRIEKIKREQANKAGENPLNVIKFRSAEKRAKRAARA